MNTENQGRKLRLSKVVIRSVSGVGGAGMVYPMSPTMTDCCPSVAPSPACTPASMYPLCTGDCGVTLNNCSGAGCVPSGFFCSQAVC